MKISSHPDFEKHLNQHNVIFIDFSKMPFLCEGYYGYIISIAKNSERFDRKLSIMRNCRAGYTLGCVGSCTEDDRGMVYNPRFVICALTENHLGEYWTSTGPYDEITMERKNREDIFFGNVSVWNVDVQGW